MKNPLKNDKQLPRLTRLLGPQNRVGRGGARSTPYIGNYSIRLTVRSDEPTPTEGWDSFEFRINGFRLFRTQEKK